MQITVGSNHVVVLMSNFIDQKWQNICAYSTKRVGDRITQKAVNIVVITSCRDELRRPGRHHESLGGLSVAHFSRPEFRKPLRVSFSLPYGFFPRPAAKCQRRPDDQGQCCRDYDSAWAFHGVLILNVGYTRSNHKFNEIPYLVSGRPAD